MSADLGARLQRAGLVTREQLAETMASVPLHGAALVKALVRRGVAEDAIVGYFLAEGFGPLLGARDLEAADPELIAQVPPTLLREFGALPVRRVDGRWVVAMIAPAERHLVVEMERIAGQPVIPTVARWTDLREALEKVGGASPSEPVAARPPSEPPVFELVRRRPSVAPAAPAPTPPSPTPPSPTPPSPDSGYRPRSAPPPIPAAKLQLDEGEPVPLVRTKPVQHATSAPPPAPPRIASKSFPAPTGLWKRPRAGTVPLDVDGEPAPAGAPARQRSSTAPLDVDGEPAEAVAPTRTPRSRQLTPLERSAAIAAAEHAEPYALRRATEPPSAPAASAAAPPVRTATLPPPPPSTPPETPPAAAVSAAEDPVLAPSSLAAAVVAAPEAEPPAPSAEGSWALPPARALPGRTRPSVRPEALSASKLLGARLLGDRPTGDEVPSNKLPVGELAARAVRDLVPHKAPIGDVGALLSEIRQARERDAVVRLALDGALSVSRSVVFFALRKGVLKGWDGLGSGVSQDSARNLWIPTSTSSLFQRVVDSGTGFFGPYGPAIADGLFRAAVGSRGGDLALLPVKVNGKVIGLLACDDVRAGPLGQQRIEVLVSAVEEAFSRIIVEQKQG